MEENAIDKSLLADIGFVKGDGWPGEMWVYDGVFWVAFFDHYLDDRHVDGRYETREGFFAKFINALLSD